MAEIEIRATSQNALEVIDHNAAGEVVTITLRDRHVARMPAITSSRLDELIASGRARPARGDVRDLPAPQEGPCLSEELKAMRSREPGSG